MPTTLINETLISLRRASLDLPEIDGKKPCIGTIWRWTRVGVNGVLLESTRIGHRILTSKEAVDRFLVRVSEGVTS